MTAILQVGVYAILIFSIIYFGAVSVVGKAIMIGAVACGVLFSEGTLVVRRLKGQGVHVPASGSVGRFTLLWMFILGMSALFSIQQQASIMTLAVFLSYFFIFKIIVDTFDEKKLMQLYRLLFYFGCMFSLFGIITMITKDVTLFAVQKKYYLDRLTATYINPNHCASLLGMLIPCGGYFIIVAKGKAKLLYAVGTFCMMAAFVFTFSLASFIAGALTVGGALLISVLFLWPGDNRTKIDQLWTRLFKIKKGPAFLQKRVTSVSLGIMLVILAMAVGVIIAYRGSAMVTAKSFSVWERNNVYKGIMSMLWAGGVSSFWNVQTFFIGAGLGCFKEIFHGYYATYSVSEFTHAHNEYLEQLIETGVGGLSVFILMIISLGRKVWRYVSSGQHKERAYFVAALTLAVAFVLLHSIFDFPLRIPANGLLFFSMIGTLTVFVRDETSHQNNEQTAASVTCKKTCHCLEYVGNVILCALACGMILYSIQNIAVQYLITRAERDFVRKDMIGVERCFSIARRLNPHDPELIRAYGEYLRSRAFSQDMNEKAYYEKVRALYEEAIADNPHLPEHYLNMAWVLALAKQFDQAESFFDKAIAINPYFLLSHIQRAHFYLLINDLNKAAEGYTYVLDALMQMPYSPYSKANLLLDQLYSHMQSYPLHSALRGVYKRLVDYHEQFVAA